MRLEWFVYPYFNQAKVAKVSDLLHGRTLAWGSWDREGIVTAAVRDMLGQVLTGSEIHARLVHCETPGHMQQLCSTHHLGIALWIVSVGSELTELCQAIASVQERYPSTVCVCYVATVHADLVSLLVEAGARLIVDDLPTLHRALPRIVAQAPLSAQGHHPLTSGLMSRLPW